MKYDWHRYLAILRFQTSNNSLITTSMRAKRGGGGERARARRRVHTKELNTFCHSTGFSSVNISVEAHENHVINNNNAVNNLPTWSVYAFDYHYGERLLVLLSPFVYAKLVYVLIVGKRSHAMPPLPHHRYMNGVYYLLNDRMRTMCVCVWDGDGSERFCGPEEWQKKTKPNTKTN